MRTKLFTSILPRVVGALLAAMVWPTSQASAATPYYAPFSEASPSSVHPQGWLKEMLQRQVSGLASHHAVSGYPFDTCLWTGIIPKGGSSQYWKPWWPYEQTGYLVDGLERLSLVTGDAAIGSEAGANVKFIVTHPNADGSLGPTHMGPNNWPHAVVFRALMAEDEARPDAAIVEALRKHYLSRPSDFGGAGRDVCNVEEMLWVYGQTGDERLLQIAKRTYENFNHSPAKTTLVALASGSPIVEHGVTFNETAKLPAIFYMYTGDKAMLAAAVNAYEKIDRDHMMASGMHTAEEKLDGKDPWHFTETCDVSDYTWSLGYLLMATGDATWADHLEKAIFNAGLGAITKDFKSHQYFSAPNQIVAAPGICKAYNPDRQAYRPGHDVECCSGNVHRFLPNFALRQWMTTPGGGIVAAMYSPSAFTMTIDGTAVTIEEKTEYPFSETIEFVVHVSKAVSFPLSLRVPGWTKDATLTINGEPAALSGPGTFTTITRTFADGDRLVLRVPMAVVIRDWPHEKVSVERGPLVYCLKIDENAKAIQGFKTSADFPAWDKRPASAWNYALAGHEAGAIKVMAKTAAGFPWDTGNAPVELEAPAKVISNWILPPSGGNPGFAAAPEYSSESRMISLVPYGSTCLRLTVFPETGN